MSYSFVVAGAVGQALGIEGFLFKPERIHELRRLLFGKSNTGQENMVATPAPNSVPWRDRMQFFRCAVQCLHDRNR